MTDHGAALERLRALYATFPTIACKGWCWTSCGPIDMTRVERDRITDLGVEIPRFTEAAAKRWADNETTDLCPAFSLGAQNGEKAGCTVYADRPTVCRLWGVTESMRCEYGCEVTGDLLSNIEAFEALATADAIGGNEHGIRPGDVEMFRRALENPESAALMARYIEGDTSVRDEALKLITTAATERNRSRGQRRERP